MCTLQPMAGKCNAYMPMYYYDSISKQCKEFIYGGCGGNGNRFPAREECLLTCPGIYQITHIYRMDIIFLTHLDKPYTQNPLNMF